MTCQKGANLLLFFSGKAGFLMTRQKGAKFLHYYVEKQVFSWRVKISYILCIITWKSRFSHDMPKTLIFDVLKRGKAGFLMTHQKLKCTFDAFLRLVAGFLLTRQNSYILCIITWKSRFSHDAPKKCKFIALLRVKAGFLMTCQKGANLLHYYLEKQVFSWRAKIVYILCIISWKSRFSHDTPKRCKFVAFLSGKAGFLMTRQKGANLLHYFVEKQVFSWRAKISYILCIITCKSRFSHDVPKLLYLMC